MICSMYNLATVFDPQVKLSDVLILLDAYYENMMLDLKFAKAEVTKLFYDIYALYNEKIYESRLLT